MDKPDVDFIEGLSPAISIDQKSPHATAVDRGRHRVYDYLRCCTPASGAALPERRRRLNARHPSRSSTGCYSFPDGTRQVAPVVAGERVQSLLADLSQGT
jgi:excinuclease ABC subunit A